MNDYALTLDDDGGLMAHRADCREARRRAEAGEPVMTLLQCEAPLPSDLKRHSCLTKEPQP